MIAPAFFTLPKPFANDHIAVIQYNAIKSWTISNPQSDIFLIGDEIGVKEISDELRVQHLPFVQRNQFGTPLINSALHIAGSRTNAPDLVYINTDIILIDHFSTLRSTLPLDSFLLIGQRTDLDVSEPLTFRPGWESQLMDQVSKIGKLHSKSGIDYFMFQKEIWNDLPPFAVGRAGWDNGFIFLARSRNIPVIDATTFVRAVHQNHSHTSQQIQNGDWHGPERDENIRLSGGSKSLMTIADALYRIDGSSLIKNRLSFNFIQKFLFKAPSILIKHTVAKKALPLHRSAS